MKRIVSLLLAVILIVVIGVSVVPASAATSSIHSSPSFIWRYGSNNCAEKTRPELDYVSMTREKIEVHFYPTKNYNETGYAVYVDTPKQPKWHRVATLSRNSLAKLSGGLYTATVSLDNSDVYYIYGQCGANDIKKIGKTFGGRWYYPYRVTVRAINANGSLVGDFRGSAASKTRSAWLEPQYDAKVDEFAPFFMTQAAPLLNPVVNNVPSPKGQAVKEAPLSDRQLTWCVFNSQPGGKYTKYLILYYKDAKGEWKRFKRVTPAKGTDCTNVTITLTDNMLHSVGVSPVCAFECELTARAVDSDGDFISGFMPGAKCIWHMNRWHMKTNQTSVELTIDRVLGNR